MRKIVRLTESDLVKIVKRVIKENNKKSLNEIFQNPQVLFYNYFRDKGYITGFLTKDLKGSEGSSDSYYFVVGDRKTNTWKMIKHSEIGFDEKVWNKLYNLNNPQWLKLTNKDSIRDIMISNETIYQHLKRDNSAKNIVYFISNAEGPVNDSEAEAEAAFMAIDSPKKYLEVKKILGKDPYNYVKSFMDTSEVYHKQSIDSSMKRLGLLR